MSYLESAIEAGEDFELDVNGTGSKELWMEGLGWMIVHTNSGSGSLISMCLYAP
jgi:hypothetical protein